MIKTICTSLIESSFYHIHRPSAISYRLFLLAAGDLTNRRLCCVQKNWQKERRIESLDAHDWIRLHVAQHPRRSKSTRDRVKPSGSVGMRGGEASRQNTPPQRSQRKWICVVCSPAVAAEKRYTRLLSVLLCAKPLATSQSRTR